MRREKFCWVPAGKKLRIIFMSKPICKKEKIMVKNMEMGLRLSLDVRKT